MIYQFVEKAFTAWTAEIEDSIELAAKRRTSLVVAHTFEYNFAVGKVKELLAGGEIRDIHDVHCWRASLGLPPLRGGVNGAW